MNRAFASIVLSLIMLTGVTAGSAAFAESDDFELKGILSVINENTFELETRDGIETISINDDTIIDNGLSLRELDGFVVDVDAVLIDEVLVATEIEFEGEDDIIAEYDVKDYDIREKLDRYCEMTDEEKRELISKYDKAEDHVEKINEYCDLSPEDRDAYIAEHKDKYKKHTDEEFREKLDAYCDLSDTDKAVYIAEHDKTDEKAAKMNSYCTLDENGKTDFISENIDEYRAYMMDRYHDKKTDKHHMDYDRFCSMTATDRALEISDVAKLDRISEWCDMTPEEREEYKKEHYDEYKDSDKFHGSDMMPDSMPHDFDRMSDMAKDRMSDVAKDKLHDKSMKFSDESKRLKAIIMEKHDISDERHDEIRIKYEEKHGDKGDKKRTELKIKFKDHMAKIEIKITDERKSEVHDRVAEMKVFKAELRVSSDMTNEQKQELRAEFIEKAKDMQLAWISPRHQMHAGIDAADIECREGFSHVLKESNGVAMCLKADTALKMIDRGIAVPAN